MLLLQQPTDQFIKAGIVFSLCKKTELTNYS